MLSEDLSEKIRNVEIIAILNRDIDSKNNLGDDVDINVGDGTDLKIYHSATGNISYIKESGAGSFYIQATDLLLTNAAGSQTYMNASDGGSLVIRYAGANKLATTNTGIDVTGTVTADGGGSVWGVRTDVLSKAKKNNHI